MTEPRASVSWEGPGEPLVTIFDFRLGGYALEGLRTLALSPLESNPLLKDFGFREMKMAAELLQTYCENPPEFLDGGVHLMMNTH